LLDSPIIGQPPPERNPQKGDPDKLARMAVFSVSDLKTVSIKQVGQRKK
jgi:hypothetical protein